MLSGCMTMNPIPVVDQSVFRKTNLELLIRRRRDDVIRLGLHWKNTLIVVASVVVISISKLKHSTILAVGTHSIDIDVYIRRTHLSPFR